MVLRICASPTKLLAARIHLTRESNIYLSTHTLGKQAHMYVKNILLKYVFKVLAVHGATMVL